MFFAYCPTETTIIIQKSDMKICLQCETCFNSKSWLCPSCNKEPLKCNDILLFAPQLSDKNDGFKADYFKNLFRVEASNFWFRSRNKLLIWAIKKYFPSVKSFLEIGCGTGFVLSAIEKEFPQINLYGSEIYSEGLSFASSRVSKTKLMQMDAKEIPYKDEFEMIGAFDTLEHIREDEIVLKQIYKALKPGGGIMLTVPQHAFLWSLYDEHGHHVRRYSAGELKLKVENAGFKVKKTISFVSILFPFLIISRLKKRKSCLEYDVMSEFKVSGVVNFILERILDFERFLIKLGMNLPFGGSLLLIATK